MMPWNAYRLVYMAISPIHIGWHTLGYIKLTRYYITGRAVWGALTANLTRTYGAEGIGGYEKFGSVLKEEVLTSYFYPAIDQKRPLLPHFTEQGLVYGPHAREVFERLFIASFGQTAILPQSNAAEDESLHESEYISPCVNEGGESKQVFFVGYLFIKEGASVSGRNIGWADGGIHLEPVIREVFVGGDMKYGWGRLKLSNNPESEGHQREVFGFNFASNGALPCLEIAKGCPLPAHLEIESGIKVKGDIEPLVGREWGEIQDSEGKQISGAGQRITRAKICWMPGSVITEEKTLRIGEFGILTKRGLDG